MVMRTDLKSRRANSPRFIDTARASKVAPPADLAVPIGPEGREFCLYTAQMGYDLQEELDFLSYRAIEPNVFFTGRFLAPAMPRVDERTVRLALLRDEDGTRSRLRFLMPFTIERPGYSLGSSIIRAWSNPFAPLGTPLLDGEGAVDSMSHMLEAFANPALGLPDVLVFPDLRLNGPFARLARAVAINLNLPMDTTDTVQRPMLDSLDDGPNYLKDAITPHHYRDMQRQWRKLAENGALAYDVARQPQDIHFRLEEFLALEASGWKGQKRTAMVTDRYHAAFAREAVTNLADSDAVRIHTLSLDGQVLASMIVLLMGGEAFTWKTAYNEAYASFSPGKLLAMKVTEWNLDDPNISRSDSCAVPDHPIMSRFWKEREDMGTLIIGLKPSADRDVRQVAAQLHLYRNTRQIARMLRQKLRSLTRR